MGKGDARPRVAIWGHYHGHNLGDDIVVAAIAQNLRLRVDDVELVGISLDPADTRSRHGIPAIPLRWTAERPVSRDAIASTADSVKARHARLVAFGPTRRGGHAARRAFEIARLVAHEPGFLVRSSRRLAGVDLVVVAGSGPISDDWKGPWSHPYTILKWSLLARGRGVPFAFLAVGAGPIDHRLSRFFLAQSLRLAALISVRDEHSADLIRSMGVDDPVPVMPDLALSMEVPPVPTREGSGPLVVGLGPIPYLDARYWPTWDDEGYRLHVDKMATFAEHELARGHRLVLLYSQTLADPPVCDDVMAVLAERGCPTDGVVERPEILSIDDLFAALGRCDYVVAGRFHCILLPFLTGRPAVGIAYHPKTFALMDYLGQSRYCVDVDAFDARGLAGATEALESEREAAVARAAERIPHLRAQLHEHFDALVELLLGPDRESPHSAAPPGDHRLTSTRNACAHDRW
ncbi:polysaccharide pyruvyl transferase family protein [Terrabacter sp. LjRoot27]|uniref:polysaccharide pyruvyl transferase family protein n=1 Tax=Terrabacter sp. LjRoot27 TaxID=3342306 RepID=UPI003ED0CDC7